jgi:hypothetical protein
MNLIGLSKSSIKLQRGHSDEHHADGMLRPEQPILMLLPCISFS